MKKPTYEEIAKLWDFWCEYADPAGTMSREEFNALSFDQRVNLLLEWFGSLIEWFGEEEERDEE